MEKNITKYLVEEERRGMGKEAEEKGKWDERKRLEGEISGDMWKKKKGK